MKLTVLVDNNTEIDQYYFGEPGVSYLIETEGRKILFDTGYSDIFIKNASKMGESLLDLDYVVLSHGHNDHTWGLAYLMDLYSKKKSINEKYKIPTLIAHSYIFLEKEFLGENIGVNLSKEQLSINFNVKLTEQSIFLTDNLAFLGEIPRVNDFENKTIIGKYIKNGKREDDYVFDDSAIVFRGEKGLVVITGCSHAGICNIVAEARKVFKINKIFDIIGGFHLLNPKEDLMNKTLEYLGNQKIEKIHPCHCTDLGSKIKLSKILDIGEVGVGMVFEYK